MIYCRDIAPNCAGLYTVGVTVSLPHYSRELRTDGTTPAKAQNFARQYNSRMGNIGSTFFGHMKLKCVYLGFREIGVDLVSATTLS